MLRVSIMIFICILRVMSLICELLYGKQQFITKFQYFTDDSSISFVMA